MEIQIDMYQTLALSVVVLMLGQFLKQKINFLEKFCIPSPVVGGLIFSVLTCILYSTGVVEFTFDDTLREVCIISAVDHCHCLCHTQKTAYRNPSRKAVLCIELSV